MSSSWFEIILEAAEDFFDQMKGNALDDAPPGNVGPAAAIPAVIPVAPAPVGSAAPAPVVPLAPAAVVPPDPPEAPEARRQRLRDECKRLEGGADASANTIMAMIPRPMRETAYANEIRFGDHPLVAAARQRFAEAGAPAADLNTVEADIRALGEYVDDFEARVAGASSNFDTIHALFLQFQARLDEARLPAELFALIRREAWANSRSALSHFFTALPDFTRRAQAAVTMQNQDLQDLREASKGESAGEVARMVAADLVEIDFGGPSYYKSPFDLGRDRFGGAWKLRSKSLSGAGQWIRNWELHIHGVATRDGEGKVNGFTVTKAHIKPSKLAIVLNVSIDVDLGSPLVTALTAGAAAAFSRWANSDKGSNLLALKK